VVYPAVNGCGGGDASAQHPLKKEPSDPREFPGKMDHTTCIAFRVGPFVNGSK
jgi:hypothetical protein